MSVLSPSQCRAGRQWIGMTQRALARAAHVCADPVIDFEAIRRAPLRKTIDALQHVLESQNLVFTFDDEGVGIGLTVRGQRPNHTKTNWTLTPLLCRVGRGWLNWTQQDLATRSEVGLSTIRDFEKEYMRRGRPYEAMPQNIDAMLAAFRDEGVHMLFNRAEQPIGIEWDRQRVERRRLVA